MASYFAFVGWATAVGYGLLYLYADRGWSRALERWRRSTEQWQRTLDELEQVRAAIDDLLAASEFPDDKIAPAVEKRMAVRKRAQALLGDAQEADRG